MRFSGVESGANNVFGAKWQFIKARGQDPWAERAAAPGCEGWLIIYYGVGGGKDKGRF